jgi:hypothetical protein
VTLPLVTEMRIQLAPILRSWRTNSDSVYLRLRADVPVDVLARAVREAIPDQRGGEPVSTWPPVPVPGAVVLFVSYAESAAALDAFLADLAARLTDAVGPGAIDTFRPVFSPVDRPGTDFFATAVVLSPRIAEPGRVDAATARPSREDVVPEELDAVVRQALEWCHVPGGRHFVRLGVTSLRAEPEQWAALLRTGLEDPHASSAVTSTDWPRTARQVVVTPDGQVVVLFGSGEGFDAPGAALAEATALMRAAAPHVDHAFAFRTTRSLPDAPVLLQWAWPRLPDLGPGQLDDLRRLVGPRTYDAFGLQMLSTAAVDSLAGSLHAFARRRVDDRLTLLVHDEAERWFAGGNPSADDLAPARAELRPLLLTARDLERERARQLP